MLKIAKTNNFISERVKVKPITNAELDKAKQDMMKPVEIDINSVDVSVFDEFGYVLETQNSQQYITLGNENNPDFVKKYKHAINCTDTLAITHCKFKHFGKNWFYIAKGEYCYRFPNNNEDYQDYNIIKIYKLYGLKPDDIKTEEQLEKVYTRYGLNSIPW